MCCGYKAKVTRPAKKRSRRGATHSSCQKVRPKNNYQNDNNPTPSTSNGGRERVGQVSHSLIPDKRVKIVKNAENKHKDFSLFSIICIIFSPFHLHFMMDSDATLPFLLLYNKPILPLDQHNHEMSASDVLL